MLKNKLKVRAGCKKGWKIKVHPLFIALGLYYAITGKLFLFLSVTLCAVMHELGHSFVANANGYCLNKLTLMPFGAVCSGKVDGLKPIDQIKIALAGPIVNFAVSFLFIALWWVFPEVYPYTDVAVYTGLSLAVVNLIPAYPLDGGRVLYSILCIKFSSKVATKVCKGVGIILGVLLLGLFVFSLFSVVNLSLLFFSLFVLLGALDNGKENRYIKNANFICQEGLERGMPVKIIAVDKQMPVKKLMSILSTDALNEVFVFDGQNKIKTLSQKSLNKIIFSADIYSPIEKYI